MRNIKTLLAVFSLMFIFSFAASAQGVSLTSIDGTRVDVQGRRDKIVVLAIGASWLPLSAQQALITNKLAKKYNGRDVEIYFVATDSIAAKSKNYASDADINQFATANKMTVQILRDSDGAATLKKFGIDQIPAFVIIDKDGKQATEAFGGMDPKSDISLPISQAIDKLL